MQSTQLSESDVFGEPQEAKCWVYEVYASGRLVYVGIADNFERRWSQHVQNSWWLGEVEVDAVSVLGYRSRSEARMEEAARIHHQNPPYNTNREASSYRRWMAVTGGEPIPSVARRAFRPNGWDAVPVAASRTLGLEAIGLWYRARETFGDQFNAADLHLLHPDPNAWGPFDEKFDLEGPLSQLLALGYAREGEEGTIRLFPEGCA